MQALTYSVSSLQRFSGITAAEVPLGRENWPIYFCSDSCVLIPRIPAAEHENTQATVTRKYTLKNFCSIFEKCEVTWLVTD